MGTSGMKFPVPQGKKVIVRAAADVNLRGWTESDIVVEPVDQRRVRANVEGGVLFISSNEDLWVSLPAEVDVRVEHTGGDAECHDLPASVEFVHVGGDLTLHGASKVDIGNVGGDVVAKEVKDSIVLRRCGGDFTGEAQGSVMVDMVGGDLHLSAGGGPVRLRCGGDATVALTTATFEELVVKAGGEVMLHVAETLDARFDLSSGSREIMIDLPDLERHIEKGSVVLDAGKGGQMVRLKAGGDIIINSDPYQDISIEDENLHDSDWGASDRVFVAGNWSVMEDRIQRRAEEAARRAEERVRAAMERVERSMRFGDKFGQFDPWIGTPPVPPSWPEHVAHANHPEPGGHPGAPADVPPVEPQSKISNDERMLVLKMLQEQKITLEEAEQLLAALEGLD